MLTFSIGNEAMLDLLFRNDEHFMSKEYAMVSTCPGLLKTDLHCGQGIILDIIEGITVHVAGVSKEEAGIRQSSILTSQKLHRCGLTMVDDTGYGRLSQPEVTDFIEQNGDWLWSFLTTLENKPSCTN